MKKFLASLILLVGALIPALGQEHRIPATDTVNNFTNQNTFTWIGSTYYAGNQVYPTVQATVDIACVAVANNRVVIPRDKFSGFDVTTLTGCVDTQVEDDRPAAPIYYTWNGSVYTPQGVVPSGPSGTIQASDGSDGFQAATAANVSSLLSTGISSCAVQNQVYSPSTGTCLNRDAAGVIGTIQASNGDGTFKAASSANISANFIAGYASCAITHQVYSPADGGCIAVSSSGPIGTLQAATGTGAFQSATSSNIASTLLSAAGCSVSGNVYSPFNNTCITGGGGGSAPIPAIGQYLSGNGSNFSTAYVAFPGLLFYGDSNMCGFGASDYTGDPSTPASLGAALGFAAITGPDYGGSSSNYCKTGAYAGDASTLEVYQSPVAYTHQSPSLIVIGTNDANFCGATTGCENNFKAALAAAVQWRGIPTSSMVTAVSMTKTSGTWTTDSTVLGGTVAAYSNTANAVLTGTITSYGQPIMLGWMASAAAGGIFSVQIDGNLPCANLTSGGFNGQTPTTNLGTSVVLFATKCPAAAGTHTVTFTKDNTTNYGEIAYITTPLGNPGFSPNNLVSSPPQVFVGSILRQYLDANSSTTSTYDSIVQSVVTDYFAAGLNVKYIDMRGSYINSASSTDMNCGSSNQALHLCDKGYVQQRDAFEAQVIPMYSGSGGSGGCSTNCTFNGITQLRSNIANGGVANLQNINSGGYTDLSYEDTGGTARLATGYANNASDPNLGNMAYVYSTGKDLCVGATSTMGNNPCLLTFNNSTGVGNFTHPPTGISVGLRSISATITPGPLTAGTCVVSHQTISGVGLSNIVIVNPRNYLGDGAYWTANIPSANTVDIHVCVVVAGTPNSSDFEVYVYP